MPDYTPVFLTGRQITLTASVACSGGDLLEVSGSGTVRPWVPNAVPSQKAIGVAGNDTPVNGRVTVYGFGPVHESVADGTVTAGDQLVAASTAARQVKTLVPSAADLGATYVQATVNAAVNLAVNNTRSIIGIALTTVADNLKVRWMQFPG